MPKGRGANARRQNARQRMQSDASVQCGHERVMQRSGASAQSLLQDLLARAFVVQARRRAESINYPSLKRRKKIRAAVKQAKRKARQEWV